MKSLTHDFEYIDSFVTLFYVGRSHHLQKSSKINILNRALQAPRLIDWNRVLTVGVHQFQSSTRVHPGRRSASAGVTLHVSL